MKGNTVMQKCITFISLSAEGNFISHMLDAKNLMQKSGEKQKREANISIEQAKRMQNGPLYAWFRFEAKKILSESGSTYCRSVFKELTCAKYCMVNMYICAQLGCIFVRISSYINKLVSILVKKYRVFN
jgi:hypothetical protein